MNEVASLKDGPLPCLPVSLDGGLVTERLTAPSAYLYRSDCAWGKPSVEWRGQINKVTLQLWASSFFPTSPCRKAWLGRWCQGSNPARPRTGAGLLQVMQMSTQSQHTSARDRVSQLQLFLAQGSWVPEGADISSGFVPMPLLSFTMKLQKTLTTEAYQL